MTDVRDRLKGGEAGKAMDAEDGRDAPVLEHRQTSPAPTDGPGEPASSEPILIEAVPAEPMLTQPPVQQRSLVARVLSPVRRRVGRDVVVGGAVARPEEVELPARVEQRRLKAAAIISAVVVILLPILAAGVYLFAFASDQYVADMRFVVRKADAPRNADGVASGGGSVSSSSLLAGGANMSGEDAEIIASYIHSRAAIEDVSRTVDVEAIYQRPEADFWARLRPHPEIEQLVKYWNRMIGVYVEPTSGIVSVSVTAFRREDALVLAKAILASSDRLANSLTEKMRADQTRLAEDEVRRAEGSVRFALADLTSFRNSQRLIDPVASSKSTGTLLTTLLGDRIQTESQLFVIQRAQGPSAPGIAGIKARLQSINQHISELQDQMAGNKEAASNLAATLSQFEELEVKKQFAEKLFEFARQGLERAQLTAMSTSIYLAVFMAPSLPQDYSFPNRTAVLMLVALASVMTWLSGAIITASVLDHRL